MKGIRRTVLHRLAVKDGEKDAGDVSLSQTADDLFPQGLIGEKQFTCSLRSCERNYNTDNNRSPVFVSA